MINSFVTYICFRPSKSPPLKKEKSEEREKATQKGTDLKLAVNSEKSPKTKDKKSPIISKKSNKNSKTESKSPKTTTAIQKVLPTSIKQESLDKVKTEDTDIKDGDKMVLLGKRVSTGEDVESPSKTNKPINPFFLPKKELKVQSVGAGLKGADYSPDKTKYNPIKDAFWSYGEK